MFMQSLHAHNISAYKLRPRLSPSHKKINQLETHSHNHTNTPSHNFSITQLIITQTHKNTIIQSHATSSNIPTQSAARSHTNSRIPSRRGRPPRDYRPARLDSAPSSRAFRSFRYSQSTSKHRSTAPRRDCKWGYGLSSRQSGVGTRERNVQ